jgi:hypothetical protein
MKRVNRRQFGAAAVTALGGTVLGGSAGQTVAAAEPKQPRLPTVRWGEHEITRLLAGHNVLKACSHLSRALDREMKDYFGDGDKQGRGRGLLRRCEQLGITACQMGGVTMEALLRSHYAEGGKLKWITTYYTMPGEERRQGKEELKRIMQMRPKPIGAQVIGNNNDHLFSQGKLDVVKGTLSMLRDAGLLVGLGSHNHEVIDYAADKDWDLDFYQCCFYHSTFGLDGRRGEVFEEPHRQAMVKVIKQLPKPCIAYKVLGASRHCRTPADIERALRFAFENIKPIDVVVVGMWQKYKDQAAENVGFTRRILSGGS